MVLSIEDETDNRLRLVKDGIGVEFTGKLPYNSYFVLAGRLALLASRSTGQNKFGFAHCGRADPASGILAIQASKRPLISCLML